MSGLCGFINNSVDKAENLQVIQRMVSALKHHIDESPHILNNPHSALAVTSTVHNFDVYQNNEVIAVVYGHPHYVNAADNQATKPRNWAKYLADGYQHKGLEILNTILGSFAIALIFNHGKEVFLATDRMGSRPLIYTQVSDCLVFGSSLDALNNYPLVKPDINLQSIYNYVYFHVVPGPDTIYLRQQRLLPGSYLWFKNGKLTTGSYWKIRFVEHERRSFAELKEEFIHLLQSSVQPFANQQDVGAFLSGGTDSSTVSGMLTKISKKPAHTYSIGFDAEGYDEMGYARITAHHFGTLHHEYYVTPDDVIKAIPRIAAIYDMPFGNASAVPAYYCARMAKDEGINLLLAGDGGDELFGGNERYAKQYIFSLYSDLPSRLRKGLIEPVLYALPAGNSFTPIQKVRSYIEQASVPMPGRLQTYNLLNRLGTERIFSTDFLASIKREQPLAILTEVYLNASAQSMINRMLALDLKFTLTDSDLPKVNQMCEMAGVDVAYPLLNDELVAFSTRLEPRLKLKGTKLRYFFKEALRDFLPDEIISKQKHGFGLPFGMWLHTYQPLQDLAYDSLKSLDSRGIIRPGFIDELIETHRAGHAAYYGTLVWVLMMLEMWFSKKRS